LAHRKKIRKGKIAFSDRQAPVSVIICAKNEEENLRKNLPAVLEQDYPDFEVIVINDGSDDETDYVLEELKTRYPHLRTTFVPTGTKNLSTKKFGITLAVKAAKNDLLLFTDADCVPAGKRWISNMARNFVPGTEIVLGYGAYSEENTLLNRMITYDTLFIGLQYMGMATAKAPYMGVGRNLAYRKELFLRRNGFAESIHLISGDDDLFINKAANKHNTRIETTPESITFSEAKKTFPKWIYQKLRHLSVSGNYTAKSKFRLVLEPLTRGVFYALFIALLCLGNLITIAAAVLLLLIRTALQSIIINESSKYSGGRRYVFLLPVFDIILPLINLYILAAKRPFSEKGKITKWEM
jgi:cellulose synthase/poly-beta-1,6-N-acetylglucosamine synthase-like glycosyltransferase